MWLFAQDIAQMVRYFFKRTESKLEHYSPFSKLAQNIIHLITRATELEAVVMFSSSP